MSFNPVRTETCRFCRSIPDGPVIRCERCKVAFYCVRAAFACDILSNMFVFLGQREECRRAAAESHLKYCKAPRTGLPMSPPSGSVTGVRLLGGDIPFVPQVILVNGSHPVWPTGTVSPLSQLVDMPILIYRERRELPLDRRNIMDLDNQAVTHIMVDPETGIAPARRVFPERGTIIN